MEIQAQHVLPANEVPRRPGGADGYKRHVWGGFELFCFPLAHPADFHRALPFVFDFGSLGFLYKSICIKFFPAHCLPQD
jgi:hypothetical protein